MENTDVLVVGGSAAGIVAATTGKSFYGDILLTYPWLVSIIQNVGK